MSAAAAHGGFRYRIAMVTLTYRPESSWQANHVRDFQESLQKYMDRRGIEYRAVWVLELTRRGVPHYHVLVWLPRGSSMPMPDKQGWWPHGMTRVEWTRNAIGYMVKYTSKAHHASSFPRGARLFGVRGLRGTFRRDYRLRMLPYWLKQAVGPGVLCRRLAGGWWLSEDGVLLQSPWMIVGRAADWSWVEFGPRVVVPFAEAEVASG